MARAAVEVRVGRRVLTLTNLDKPFWSVPRITKGDLLTYYTTLAPVLVPHLRNRPMVLRRYPDGAAGKSFFQKQVPDAHPPWLATCTVVHSGGKRVTFPLVQDLASLLWVVNLGCIDLNPWPARADDTDRPDFLHFDLDPVPGANFARVREAALVVRAALVSLEISVYAKTTGSRGMHLYVPIRRGPRQRQVWEVARVLAQELAARHPSLLTAERSVARRRPGTVNVDYNQNAWGQTLASVYSVRPTPRATVSTPVTWKEVEAGCRMEDFTLATVPDRVRRCGDLGRPLLARGRYNLAPLVEAAR